MGIMLVHKKCVFTLSALYPRKIKLEKMSLLFNSQRINLLRQNVEFMCNPYNITVDGLLLSIGQNAVVENIVVFL